MQYTDCEIIELTVEPPAGYVRWQANPVNPANGLENSDKPITIGQIEDNWFSPAINSTSELLSTSKFSITSFEVIGLLLIASVGLTLIIKDSLIFKAIREFLQKQCWFFRKLLACAQCLGFWCGLVLALLFCISTGQYDLTAIYMCLLCGFGSSILALTVNLIIDWLDTTVFLLDKKSSTKELLNESKK